MKFPSTGGVYHCMSRCVQGRHLLNREAQAVFRRMLRQVAEFSGIEVITFCVMQNHFHILIRVPPKQTVPSDAELERRYGLLYTAKSKYAPMPPYLVAQTLAGENSEPLRTWLLRRMHSVSEFMRTLNLRFSLWYNRTHAVFGAAWAGRYKAVLIEDKPSLVTTGAAYIDLNPVRAGLVKDPKDYRFSGYGEAAAGQFDANRGICRLMQSKGSDPASRLAAYRCLLFCRALRGARGRATVDEAVAERVLKKERGVLPLPTLAALRLKFLVGSAVLGSQPFVRKFISNETRKRPAETGIAGLCALRMPRP